MSATREVRLALSGIATLSDDDTVSDLLERSGIYAGMLIGEVVIESVEEE